MLNNLTLILSCSNQDVLYQNQRWCRSDLYIQIICKARNPCKILLVNFICSSLLARQSQNWEDDTKIDVREARHCHRIKAAQNRAQ